MQVYKLVMRRSILTHLVDRLRTTFDLEFPRGTEAIDRISILEIDELLSYRSDPMLDELRGALTRLDDGTFGTCIGCKNRMGWGLLLRDPARRVCPNCEHQFRNPIPHASVSAYQSL